MTQSFAERVLAETQEWLGTPYRHQCSLKGVGCDCLGLVRGIYRALNGFEPMAPPPYTPDWAEALKEETLLNAAREHLIEIPIGGAVPGDIMLFRPRRGAPAKHAAILTRPGRMIHAYWGRAVCETAIGPWWRERQAAAFRFPEYPLQR
jgi:NlpC/P60 family putative phage cell wall peptidase